MVIERIMQIIETLLFNRPAKNADADARTIAMGASHVLLLGEYRLRSDRPRAGKYNLGHGGYLSPAWCGNYLARICFSTLERFLKIRQRFFATVRGENKALHPVA